MRFYIIIFIFLSLEYAYNNASSTHQIFDGNSDCLTDELYGDFTDEKYNNLVKRRKFVKTRLQNQLYKNELDTLFVPVVFHNLHKLTDNGISNSYCDYVSGAGVTSYQYITGNSQHRCKERIDRSLEVLNLD